MNGSPESRLVARWIIIAALLLIANVLAPRANENGHLIIAIYIGGVLTARILGVTTSRYEYRNGPTSLRLIWYAFLVEVALLGTAFALAINDGAYAIEAWGALVAAIGLEIWITRFQDREHRRYAICVPKLRSVAVGPDCDFSAECWGGLNEDLKNELRAVFPNIATVVRAYLVTATYKGQLNERILALRFAFPWSDDDALRAASIAWATAYGPDVEGFIVMLNDTSERRALAVAQPFYQRAAKQQLS